jgi:signal transduction histidine kinase
MSRRSYGDVPRIFRGTSLGTGTVGVSRVLRITLTMTIAAGCAMWLSYASPSAYPVTVVASNLVGTALVGSGLAMASDPLQRGSGLLLVLAGFAWLGAGLYNVLDGAAPFIGQLVTPVAPALLVIAVARFPHGNIPDRLERWLLVAALTLLGVTHTAYTFTGDPLPGYPKVWWPVISIGSLTGLTGKFSWAALIPLVAVGLFIVVRRFSHASGLERREIVPVIIAITMLLIEVAIQSVTVLLTQPTPIWARWLGALAPLVLPGSFFIVAFRRLLDLTRIGLLENSGRHASSLEVRNALRTTLLDPALDLYLWDTQLKQHLNVEPGQPLKLTEQDGRLEEALPLSLDHSPLAIVRFAPSLKRRTDVVGKAMGAARLNLENIRLSEDLQAQLLAVTESKLLVVRAEADGRRRIEQELHDTIQQQMYAVMMTLGRAETTCAAHPEALHIVGEAKEQVREANNEVRRIARGLYPAALSKGLHAATRDITDRLDIDAKLDIHAERFSTETEYMAYRMICEALTNVHKHSGARHVQVQVSVDNDRLVVRVADDGLGGARIIQDSGLGNLRDLLCGGYDGDLNVNDSDGGGTCLTARLKYAL